MTAPPTHRLGPTSLAGWRLPVTYTAGTGGLLGPALTPSSRIAALGADLVTEERAFATRRSVISGTRGTAPGGSAVTLLAGALAEQFPEQLHGRFPLTETDPPVGQDRTSIHTLADPVNGTTSVTIRQFPPRATVLVRRPPAT